MGKAVLTLVLDMNGGNEQALFKVKGDIDVQVSPTDQVTGIIGMLIEEDKENED